MGSPVPVVVDVLGPLRLTIGNEPVEVPGPKRRALLALLALGDGHVVPVDDLLDALWPVDMPRSALSSLHSHVSRLRSHLGPAAQNLEQLGGGYRLALHERGGGTDVGRVRRSLADARGSDPSHARALLENARSLWRGEPLAEFPDVAPLAAWAVSLKELRRTVEVAHVQAVLDVGTHADAIELATALVADEPLSETGVLLLMRSLEAAGRSADALRCGHEFRRRLVETTGLDPSDELHDVERDIASRAVRPRGAPARPTGLLHGRDSELAALHRLLGSERLVTVLGPAGVGKTRLATEAAIRAENAVTLLLGTVSDATTIPAALAAALDLQPRTDDVLAACAILLASDPGLLFVDNCEHLLDETAALVSTLLDLCPGLTVLATSREPLGLPAEQRLRLAPLPLAGPDRSQDLARSPASALFVDRARRVRADFTFGRDVAETVADIVRRVDGVPLAVELAAGRLSSLDLEDLRDRLDRALDLLGEANALRRTIDWSYALLPDDEQCVLRHLAAFPDGFDLRAAEAVARDVVPTVDPTRALTHLADASMLEFTFGNPTRYRMLAIVRSFAQERLGACGEWQQATARFLLWAGDVASWILHATSTEDEADADRRLRAELGNLRAAWRLARERNDVTTAVQIVVGVTDAATWRDLTELWDWGLELAGDPGVDEYPHTPTILGLAANSAWSRGELDRATDLVARGFALDADDPTCHATRALVALSRGALETAVEAGIHAASRSARPDQSLGVAALAAAYGGQLDQARRLNERLAESSSSPTIEAFHHYVLGEIEVLAGHQQRAEVAYDRALALATASGATLVCGIAAVGVQTLRVNGGRIAEALDGFERLLDYWERTGGWIQQWTTLRNVARLLETLGEEETAQLIDLASSAAPDAPPVPDSSQGRTSAPTGSTSPAIGRGRVLEVTRAAIARQRVRAPLDEGS